VSDNRIKPAYTGADKNERMQRRVAWQVCN